MATVEHAAAREALLAETEIIGPKPRMVRSVGVSAVSMTFGAAL
jgi:hypothetical protein